MAYTYDIDETPPADVPCVQHDIRRAKKFLQRHSSESGDSLYDHLTELVAKIISERPLNAVDIFEDLSRRLKEERYKSQTNRLRDIYVPPPQYKDAKKLIKLFQDVNTINKNEQEDLDEEENDEVRKRKPHMLDLLYFFEQVDIGLPRREMVILNLSIRRLMSTTPIENVRFWGKIIGNPKNYYVVEADLQAEELNRRLEQQHEAKEQAQKEKEETVAKVAGDEETAAKVEEEEQEKPTDVPITGNEEEKEKGLVLVFPPMPVNAWKPPVQVAPEKIGTGANKKTYFVCNEPGLDDWIELPSVTPQQIVTARQIIRCFTGNLETPIHTFPPFPGNEKNYLRAQIARISAATLVSPIGFYAFGGGDEEEEFGEDAEEEGGALSENVHYDPLPVKDLIDPSMSNWCHHSPYLLKQGRVVWWSPEKEEDELDDEVDEEEEEDEEERETGVAGTQKEVGPPLLTPLSEDATLDSVVPWTARESSPLHPDISVCLVRSNVWPGAFAFAAGRRCANLYIGWGHKYTAYNYSPPPMPQVMDQYKIGPEVMEMQDPTFEEEEVYRIAHLPPVLPVGDDEEEMAEEEEEEEEDEDDDE